MVFLIYECSLIKGFLSCVCKIAVLITADNYSLIMAFLINSSYCEIYCSGFVTCLLVRFSTFNNGCFISENLTGLLGGFFFFAGQRMVEEEENQSEFGAIFSHKP